MDVVLAWIAVAIVLSLPVAALAGVSWAALYRWRVALSTGTLAQSLWIGLGGIALAVYAFGTGSGNGLSRLEEQHSASSTFSAIGLGVVAISMLVVARRTRRRDLAAAGFVCSAAAAVLLIGAFLANTAFE
jgi:hypothetical protein